MNRPVVEVVRRRGARPVESPSAPLPPAVLAALAAIVRDMRDVPRDCIRDPAELLIWLRRLAGRVNGVGRMRIPAAAPVLHGLKGPPATLPPPRPPVPRDLAETVFGKGPVPSRAPGQWTMVNRKGRAVKVETRRARAAGQMELGL